MTVLEFYSGFSAVMPWKTRSLLEARQRLVRAALRGLKSVAQLCGDFGVSRKTGFKWLNRFRALGRTDSGRRLYIAFTVRGTSIRVISARDMTKSKERRYEEKAKRDTGI